MKRKPVLAALAAAVVLAAGGGVAAASLGADGDTSTASGTGTGATTHQRAEPTRTGTGDTAHATDDDRDTDDARDARDSDDRDGSDGDGDGDGDDRDDARERAHDAAEHEAEAAAARRLPAPDALAAALAHTPGRAVSAEIDDDPDGRLVWEVEILDRSGGLRHVDVSPSSGKVLRAHAERGEADDVRTAKDVLAGGGTSAARAARAAAAKGTVVSVDLEEERNGYWSVETGREGAEWAVALDGTKVTQESDG